jgi:hypothetical protein
MAAITTWTRIEPRVRGDDLSPSLEARVHDPAFLLGRQWQIGEFVGEDAGTPVQVKLQVQPEPLVAYRVATQERALDPGIPIDCAVGAEPRVAPSLFDRAEAGAELLQALADAGCSAAAIAALIGTNLLPVNASGMVTGEGEALLSLAAGRLPDGDAVGQLFEDLAATGQAPAALALSAGDAAAAVVAARDWLAWRASLVRVAPASSWVDEQLEHHFALASQPPAGAATALVAPAWDGERLDWYDLEIDRRVTAPQRPSGAPALPPFPGVDPADGLIKVQGLPAPLTYGGMPASRWWQFEDSRVNFAQVSAHPEDLARMLVVEFASVYGNDWYLWPLDLPVGAIHRITALEVSNTFGDQVTVGAAAASAMGSTTADWQLFRPTEQRAAGGPGAYDGLLLLPSLASPLEGEIFEEVRLLRDEMANLAWAVEATVRGQDGLPFDRHSDAAASGALRADPQVHGDDTGPLRYRFKTDVPVYWFPLSPDPTGAPKFRRLVIRQVDETGATTDVLPAGELLAPAGLWLWQEEVPREGARVVRRHRMARGDNGRVYVWRARRSETGRGEGSSGLRYDDALPAEAPPP